MGIKEVKKNPINMMVADADDQTLEAVIQLRKKVGRSASDSLRASTTSH